MRGPVRAALLVLMVLAAGCSAPAPPAVETGEMGLFALDGRWPFPEPAASAILARHGLAGAGALVLGEAMTDARVVDVAGLDEAAARALNVTLPPPGAALAVAGIAGPLVLRAHASPPPYVATFFEMERTAPCSVREAKLCFLPPEREGEARLRLTVEEGARDAAFLPDLVELGVSARPAWWNGSFVGPDGTVARFSAVAPRDGPLLPAELPGNMAPGVWTVSFRLETVHGLAAAGAAGIVRVREPGYLWFDDRLQASQDARDQAQAVLANLTPTRVELDVAGALRAPVLGADIILRIEDARALFATGGDVTGLLVDATATQRAALDADRPSTSLGTALRWRALPAARPPVAGDALVFAAPHDLDVTGLPPVAGLRAPMLALASRVPAGETVRVGDDAHGEGALLLAPAQGALPIALPAGARWTEAEHAIENLTRSRTLALAGPGMRAPASATLRTQVGEGNASRTLVVVGGVLGGPSDALWTSAAFASGAARPALPRIVAPLAPGADPEAARAAALAAWGAHGVVADVG